MRETKEESVIVKCRDYKEAATLKDSIKNNMSDNFSTSVPVKKNQCLKIVGIKNEYNEKNLILSLKRQNSNIFKSETFKRLVRGAVNCLHWLQSMQSL